MEKFRLRKSESTYQGKYTCNWVVDVVSECSSMVIEIFDTEQKAKEYIKTHNATEEVNRVHKETAQYMKEHNIIDECKIDDGKLHSVVNGYIVEKKGNQEEWEGF